MAASKVKVTIKRVGILTNAAMTAPSLWQFDIKVTQIGSNKTTTLGDPAQKHAATVNGRITLNWTADIDLALSDTQLKVVIKAKDVGGVAPVDLGDIETTFNVPITYARKILLSSSKVRYNLRVFVDPLTTTPGFSGPVTTILKNTESSTHNTIHQEMAARMVHIHPVIPVPWTNGLPPIAKGFEAMDASDQVDLGIDGTATDLNAMVNPCVIPVVDPTDPDFLKKCARIRITQVRPKNLDVSKLIWKSTSDAVKFWVGTAKSEVTGGLEVNAYGHLTDDKDQEAKIEVRWDEPGKPLLATFRAWVGKTKYVWTRANIVKTDVTKNPGAINPSADAALMKKLLIFNNVILWQAGILLAFDNDKTPYDGATVLDEGIFEITKDTNFTFNIPSTSGATAPMFNSRANIFNVTVIHSVRNKPNLLGVATDRCLSPAADGTATSSGSPSTSWVRPTGVFPDDGGQTLTMKTMGQSTVRPAAIWPNFGDGNIDKLCAVLLTDSGSNTEGDLTMAHELCHVLGLHHRGNGGNETYSSYDGVNHLAGPRSGRGAPWNENLMTYGDNSEAQDIDILQASVIRTHPLLRNEPPPKKPPPPKPLPAEYLPTKEDIILLQEYLIGKKPGLIHKGYNIGPYGPDADGVDGILGHETKQGIKDFQKDHGGLKIDGIYGPKTRGAFDEELNPKT